jgi:tetratricopeptide (TPR) repeat protein
MKFSIAAFILIFIFTPLFSQSVEQRQFQLAQSYEQQGDLEGASRIYLELAKNNLKQDEFLTAYVRTVKHLNKYQEILDYMLERIKLTPNMISYIYLGEAYWLKGFPDEANLAFNNALEKAVSQEDFILLSESLSKLKQYNKAIEVLLFARKSSKKPQLFADELSKFYILIGDKKNGINEILNNLKVTRNLATAQGRLYALMLDEQSKIELDQILDTKYSENKSDSYVLYLYIWFSRTAGNFQKALDLTIDMDKLQNSNYSEILRFANQCKNDGQHDIAIKGYLLVIEQGKTNPNTSSALYGLARSMEQKNLSADTISKQNLEQITNIYNKIIKEYPNTIQELEGIYRLAVIAEKNEKNYPKSIELLKKISKRWGLIPVFVEAQFSLSNQYLKIGKLEEAQQVLQTFVKNVPPSEIDNQKRTIENANFLIAKIYYYLGKIDSTRAVLDRIPANSDSEVMNDILEFYAFLNKNQNLNAALNAFSQAELLELQERPNDAIEKFQESEKFAEGDELEEASILRIAQIYYVKKQYTESNAEYEKILDNFPNSINLDLVYYRIGFNLNELKKYDEAVQTLTKIIMNYPKSIYYEDARRLIREIREKSKES